jgi:hypothetical protein
MDNQAQKKAVFYENTFYGHLSMPQTHKWLDIFTIGGEAKLHRGLVRKYILRTIVHASNTQMA